VSVWWHLALFPAPAHKSGFVSLPDPAFRLNFPKGNRGAEDSVQITSKTTFKAWNQQESAAKLQEPKSTKPISSIPAVQIQSFDKFNSMGLSLFQGALDDNRIIKQRKDIVRKG